MKIKQLLGAGVTLVAFGSMHADIPSKVHHAKAAIGLEYPTENIVIENRTDEKLNTITAHFSFKGKIGGKRQTLTGFTTKENLMPNETVTLSAQESVDKNGVRVSTKFAQIKDISLHAIKIGKMSRRSFKDKILKENKFIVTQHGTLAPYRIETEDEYNERIKKKNAAKLLKMRPRNNNIIIYE